MRKSIVLLCVLLMMGGCGLIKKAPELELSEYAEITIYHENEQDEEKLNPEQIKVLIESLNQMLPTSIPSVNDAPNQEFEYSLKLEETDKSTIIFFYQENGKYYAEIPYTGVYECDVKLYHSLSQYTK